MSTRNDPEVKTNAPRSEVKWTRILLASAVSTVLLILLFYHYRASEVFLNLRSVITSGWILLALCISLICDGFAGPEKWRRILHVLGHRIAYRVVLYLNFATNLFVDLLPMRSGELFKAWYLLKNHHVPIAAGVGSLFLKIAFSMGALLLLGLVGWISLLFNSLVIGVGSACVVLIVFLLVTPPTGRFLVRILPDRAQEDSSFHGKILDLARNISVIRMGSLTVIILYSIFLEFIEIVSAALIFKAFSIEVGFVELMAYLPVVMFIGRLPISIGGLGIRESMMILAFHDTVQMPSGELLGIGLMYSFIGTILPILIGIPFTSHFLITLWSGRSRQ